jgi:hypothetical protein
MAISIMGHSTPLLYGPLSFVRCQCMRGSWATYLECEDEDDFHDGEASCECYCSNGSGPHSPLAVVD